METNREKWMELCELAAREPDPNKLLALTNEIARLLDEKRKSQGGLPSTQASSKSSLPAETHSSSLHRLA
jgi:hypothetical protein